MTAKLNTYYIPKYLLMGIVAAYMFVAQPVIALQLSLSFLHTADIGSNSAISNEPGYGEETIQLGAPLFIRIELLND
ncbi:MAG: hypothetical protein NTV06_02690, partial [candidate division Zixibacteria bacterium]|nr:hypothetical protein [candidate division Zixibacteria bacterium]